MTQDGEDQPFFTFWDLLTMNLWCLYISNIYWYVYVCIRFFYPRYLSSRSVNFLKTQHTCSVISTIRNKTDKLLERIGPREGRSWAKTSYLLKCAITGVIFIQFVRILAWVLGLVEKVKILMLRPFGPLGWGLWPKCPFPLES